MKMREKKHAKRKRTESYEDIIQKLNLDRESFKLFLGIARSKHFTKENAYKAFAGIIYDS